MAVIHLTLVTWVSLRAIVEAQQDCSVTDYTWNAINGQCYKIVSNAQRYTTAKALCEYDGAYLASVHNPADNLALLAIAKQRSLNVWLGAHCETSYVCGAVCVTSGVCAWADGTPFDYRNFYYTSPNTTLGKCLYMSGGRAATGQWVSTDCGVSELAAVCSLSQQFVPTPAPPLWTLVLFCALVLLFTLVPLWIATAPRDRFLDN